MFLNYMKNSPAKQRLRSLAVEISLTQLSSRPCVYSFLAELTSEVPSRPSSPVLPTLGHTHVPGMSQAFPLSPPTKAASDLVELTVSDLGDINMHSHQEGPRLGPEWHMSLETYNLSGLIGSF